MRGLRDLNRSLSSVGYSIEKVVKYVLKGDDGSRLEFENKKEALRYIEVKGLKRLPKASDIRVQQY